MASIGTTATSPSYQLTTSHYPITESNSLQLGSITLSFVVKETGERCRLFIQAPPTAAETNQFSNHVYTVFQDLGVNVPRELINLIAQYQDLLSPALPAKLSDFPLLQSRNFWTQGFGQCDSVQATAAMIICPEIKNGARGLSIAALYTTTDPHVYVRQPSFQFSEMSVMDGMWSPQPEPDSFCYLSSSYGIQCSPQEGHLDFLIAPMKKENGNAKPAPDTEKAHLLHLMIFQSWPKICDGEILQTMPLCIKAHEEHVTAAAQSHANHVERIKAEEACIAQQAAATAAPTAAATPAALQE